MPRSSLVALLALLIVALPARAQWTQTSGPLGGYLYELAVTDAAVLGFPNGPLFRYDGAAWSVNDAVQYGEILAAGNDVYTSNGLGFLHSGDGGVTFAPVSPAAQRAHLLNLEGPRVWATAQSRDSLLVSADHGATWSRYYDTAWVTSFGSTFEVPLTSFAGAALEGDVVYAAATAYIFAGVYRLAPTDTSWVRVLDLGDDFVSLRSFVRFGSRLFLGSTEGAHVSADGGATWTDVTAGLPDPAGVGVYLYAGTSALYAQVGSAFFRWTGSAWASLPPLPTSYPIAVAAGARLVATTAEGVYVLGGGGWVALPRLLATSPTPVYATGPTALVRSGAELDRTDDAGATWNAVSAISGQVFTEDGAFIAAVTPSGLRRSYDGGQTWEPMGTVPLPSDWSSLRPNGFARYDGALFAAYGGSRYGKHGVLLGQYGGVFRSDDDGDSWTEVSGGLPLGSFGHSPVGFVASGGQRLFAQTEHGCATSTGTTWTSAACPDGTLDKFVTEGARWLVLTNRGVYASTDLGVTWTATTDGLPAPPGPDFFWFVSDLTLFDGAPLFVGEYGGTTRAYRLVGSEWATLDFPFPDGIRWVGFAGGDGLLFGGATSRGAWTAPLSLAAVAVTAAPVSPPVVIPAQGGRFDFTVTLTNTTSGPLTVDVWTAVAGPVSRSPVLGPRAVTLPAGATVTRTLSQAVPAAAPAGTYAYTLAAGTFPDGVLASDAFTFTKSGSAVAPPASGAAADWAVEGWDEAAASATALDAPVLGPPAPNPARDAVVFPFALPGAADVRLAVYDVLGREVAVLLDGHAEAGAHTVRFDARGLAAGTYVYRLVVGNDVQTGLVTLTR